MRYTTFSIFTIILLLTQLTDSTMYLIGVKPGDWIRYNRSYYHTSINPPYPIINGTQIIVFDDLTQNLDTNKTMVTFRQTYINPDNSTRWQTVSIADPTQPYYGHPEVAV